MTSLEVVKHLGIWDLSKMIFEVRSEFKKNIQNIPPVKGISEALTKLKKSGYSLYILSSNSKSNIESWLETNDLIHLFEAIESTTTIFGKDRAIKMLAKKHSLDLKTIIYIGDETRDIKAARNLEIPSVAVTWGYNSKEILQENEPTFLIMEPEQLLSCFI